MAKTPKKPSVYVPATNAGSALGFVFGEFDPAQIRVEPVAHVPSVDVFATKDEIIVEVELPGIRKNDIELTLYKNTLGIRAHKYECFDAGNVNFVCVERAFGKFSRTIELSCPINTSSVKASYSDGILKVTIARVEDKRCDKKSIPIAGD